MIVSDVGRMTYGSSSSLPPAMVTTASSGAKPSTCSASFWKALRDQQREIDVLMAGGLEAVVEFALQQLPDGIAVGLNDHAAFDNLGRLGHVALKTTS